jgi:serine O-acetyltransferase
MKFKEFRSLVSSDIERFAEHTDVELTKVKKLSIFLMPSIQAIFLYRLGRYFYLKGWTLVSRALFTINLVLWGTEIPPSTRIGRGFYMPHTVGVTIFAIVGERFTCYAQAGIGGGSGNESDIGAGPGLPVLGDNVLVGAKALIVGPVRIGSGTMISAGSFITYDVPENSMIVTGATPMM